MEQLPSARESTPAKSNHGIVYFSAAGSTRQLAQAIEQQLMALGCRVWSVDLSQGRAAVKNRGRAEGGEPCCLWVGSPVYCDHALPLVEEWLGRLSPAENSWAVPFVTWGGVSSGLALPELAGVLQEQGYGVLGAAKILAVHSSMWGAEQPLAGEHPDRADQEMLVRLVNGVVDKLDKGHGDTLDLFCLDYLSPQGSQAAATKSLAAAKAARPQPVPDPALCSGCGFCGEVCPVQAITLENGPQIGPECILCMQCVRYCPEQAFPFDHLGVAAYIRELAGNSDEAKESRIFL
ncbi:EFR1 family ferrodoxin [Desulfogranum mediterraneum]|uniref:EFR1 family ferrodoxin n=1 Tax=Desulfogranum mediterraneum TaxID=160661 RepID=UPI00041644A3|nr:EFR1 family ferrodoxin [Desulfogranum mediterraneum]